ncbi:MAG: NusG domain II-containing protein, partial [Bacilli bacterium]|nr:NusG domain II-containing protein [Bacilli bacterium]
DKKKIRNDIILIGIILLLAIGALIPILLTQKKNNLIAKIFVQNDLVETIDLSKKEDKYYIINGTHGQVKVHTKEGAIAIVESNCPHHDCVNMGYVSTTNRPIVCAYNAVYIEIVGAKYNDVEVG